MKTFTEQEYGYVAWQNRATGFYLATRRLHQSELYGPAAYCAAMTIELILKATLVYWDKEFDPALASHAIAKLARMTGNRLTKKIEVPEYFYFDQRYHTVSRYPKGGKGLGIPASFLEDLDRLYAEILMLVPFQHNTELRKLLIGPGASLNILRRKNQAVRSLRKFLGAPSR